METAYEAVGKELEQALLPLFLYCEKTQGRPEQGIDSLLLLSLPIRVRSSELVHDARCDRSSSRAENDVQVRTAGTKRRSVKSASV